MLQRAASQRELHEKAGKAVTDVEAEAGIAIAGGAVAAVRGAVRAAATAVTEVTVATAADAEDGRYGSQLLGLSKASGPQRCGPFLAALLLLGIQKDRRLQMVSGTCSTAAIT